MKIAKHEFEAAIFSTESLGLDVGGACYRLLKKEHGVWCAHSLRLVLEVAQLPHGFSLKGKLFNMSSTGVNIECLELIRLTGLNPIDLRYLRFGFNMPGDPAFFGKFEKDCETGKMVSSNSLMATQQSGSILVIGAGSFFATEGGITLSNVDNHAALTYSMTLDGVSLEPGACRELDSVVVLLGPDLNYLLAQWAGHLSGQMGARIPQKIPTGWNDWQYFRELKTQEHVLENAQVIATLRRQGYPLEFVQIDGGFCLHLSEWDVPTEAFSIGMARLSEKIRSMGLKFGLWLAPYIQNTKTRVVTENPNWVYLSAGQAVRFEKSNVGDAVLIDYSVDAALEWLRTLVRLFVYEWQVNWIKLDGPSYEKYRMGRPRNCQLTISEMLNRTFHVIREEAGNDVLVEGEGMMGLALGKVDLHRVQTDNHPIWYYDQNRNQPYAPTVYGKELIMGFLHQRWWCNHRENVILRDFPSPFVPAATGRPHLSEPVFSEPEFRTQIVAAVMSPCGFLLTDPMTELGQNKERFAYVCKLLPVYPHAARMVDAFPENAKYPSIFTLPIDCTTDNFHLVGLINWGDSPKEFHIPIGEIVADCQTGSAWHVFSWFDRRVIGRIHKNIHIPALSAHGGALLALRKDLGRPQLLSTSTHVTQGAVDVDSMQWEQESLRLCFRVTHFYQDIEQVYLAAPSGYSIESIETNVSSYSLNSIMERYPVIHYQGQVGKPSSFQIKWVLSKGHENPG